MPIYKLNGEVYDIPEDVVADFEKDNPNATVTYRSGNDEYEIPVSERDAFLKDFPDAQTEAVTPAAKPQGTVNAARDGGGYTPTAEEMAGFQRTIGQAQQTVRGSQQAARRIEARQKHAQKTNYGLTPGTPKLGQNSKVVETDPHFNLETGKMEGTYITEQGNEYGSRAGADIEQNAVDIAKRQMTLPGQLEDAYAERERLNAKMSGIRPSWIDVDGRVHYEGGRGGDDEMAALEAAWRANEERITALEAERDDDGGTQFWRGFVDAAKNPSTLTFGATDFQNMTQLLRIKGKVDAGKELTDGEETLLKNTMANGYAQQMFGENRGFMYRAGGISMQALPFVAEFWATGGFGGMAKGVSGTVGKGLARMTATDLSKKGLRSWLVKNTGVLAGDVASSFAMANTTGAARTGADIMERHIGQVTMDDNGQYQFEKGKSLGQSIYEGEVASTLEYYTEKLGEHLKLGKRLANVAEKYGLSRLSNAVNYLSSSKVLAAGGIQDYPSEVVEEQANLFLNAILVGDNNFNGPDDPHSVINLKTQLDIWGGMLFSIGLMQAPRLVHTGYNAAGYYAYKHTTDVADANAAIVFGEDNWQMIKEQIDNCDNEHLSELLQSVLDGGMNDMQKTATMNYAGNLLKMRGYNNGMMADVRGGEDFQSEEGFLSHGIDQGYQQGHEAQEPDEKKIIVDEANEAEARLSQMFSDEDVQFIVNTAPMETISLMLENRGTGEDGSWNDEEIAAVVDYYQKQAKAQGVMDAAVDEVEYQVAKANAEVDANTHKGLNQMIMAESGGEAFYIVGGDVVFGDSEDPAAEPHGTVFGEGTGDALIVRNAGTGEISVKSPQQLSITSVTDPNVLINQNETQLRQELMQQHEDDITFGTPAQEVFQLNDTVTLNDGQGNIIEGEIGMMPPSFDGAYVVYTADGRAMQFTADELNRMIVAHNGVEVERAAGQNPAAKPQGTVATKEGDSDALAGQSTDERPEGEAAGTATEPEQPQSALDKIPFLQDEKGNPILNRKGKKQYQWHKASVEDTADALTETTGGDMVMARDTATDLINNAKGKLEKIRKQKPRGDDPIEIAESRADIRRQEQEQQAIIKHWQDVNQAIQNRMREESAQREAERRAALTEEQRAQEDEAARQQKERQEQISAERRQKQIEEDLRKWNQPYQPLEQAKREMADDPDAMSILSDTEPQGLDEWVSSLLRPQSMMWNDEVVDGRTVTGLQSELGLSWSDMQRFGALIGGKGKGKPFGQVVHDIWEDLPEGMKNQYNDQDVRNVLLSLFNESNAKRMRNLAAERRIEQAREIMKENQRREAEWEMEAWAEAYHLTPEERETFEDFIQQPPIDIEQEVINQIIAENEEQNLRSDSLDGQPVSGTDAAGIEGGQGQVQGQVESTGDVTDAQGTTQGAKAATGEPPVSDNDVAGGASARESLAVLFDQIGAEPSLAEHMSDYEVEQLTAMVDDWDAINSDYGEVMESQKDALKSKNKAVRDEAQAAVNEAQAKSNEAFEPIEQYVESLQAKYGLYDDKGVIPTPAIDNPRYDALRQALIDAYASGDRQAIGEAVRDIRQYVDEGLDANGEYSEEVDDYEGNDPTMLADQYMIHVFQDRYLDDDEDQEYIKTGLKASMRQQVAPQHEGMQPVNSFEDMVAAIPETVTDPAMQKALRKIVDKMFLHGSSNHRSDPRGFEYIFVYMADGTNKSDRGLLKPWESKGKVEYNDDNPTATWVDEKEQRIYFIKYNPQGSVYSWDFIITGFMSMPKPIGKTSTPEEIQAEEAKVDTNPTDAQKEAGNYQKGHINIDGYDITIENPKGSVRRGTDANGTPWETVMHNTYGYIRGTEGVDGDHIDVFLSDRPTSGKVFVIDQVNGDGTFDEHKVMYGFSNEEEAKAAYLSNYSEGWQGLGAITEVSREDFKKWVQSSHRKTKPFAEYKSVKKAARGDALSAQTTDEKPLNDVFEIVKEGDVFVNDSGLTATIDKKIEGKSKAVRIRWEQTTENGPTAKDVKILNPVNFNRWVADNNMHKQEANPANVSGNRLVTDERYEQLKERMRKKLLGQMNMGIDPEILAIGTEMAVYHIEKGARAFAEYAKAMIADLGDAIRPYLKAFYNGARDLPEMAELSQGMDEYSTVQAFDVFNLGGKTAEHTDPLTKAQQVVSEKKAEREAKEAVKKIQEIAKKGSTKKGSSKKQQQVQAPSLFDMFEETKPAETETKAPETERQQTKQEATAQPQQTELKLRPATEADIDSRNPVYYYQGKRVYIVAVMRSGEQISATQFSKPKIDSIMLTNGKSVKLEDLQVEDKGAKQPAKKGNTAWWNDPNRPKNLDPSDYSTYTTDDAKAYFEKYVGPAGKDGKPFPDFTKWAHPNLAYITAAAWDGAVIPLEELQQVPEIQEAEARRLEDGKNGNLVLTPEEIEQHAQHLLDAEHGSQVYKDGKKVKDDYSGPVRQEHKALIVIGRPAGGKSSVFADRLSYENGARIVDSDVVKPWLEGFDEGYGAGVVHDASAKVAERAMDIAVENGDNMIIPRIGGPSVISKLVIPLREKGYDVQLYFNEVSEQSSIMRAASRFAQEGRYLCLEYLTTIKGKDYKTFRNFAEKNLGEYYAERDSKERPAERIAGTDDVLLERGRADGRGSEGTSRSGAGESVSQVADGRGQLRLEPSGTQGNEQVADGERIFSYAEWKSNDVAFGEKPKEIWNSKSGKPMPGSVKKNSNEGEQKVSGKPESVGQGAEQASGSTERTGTERSPKQNRAERSGSGHSIEDTVSRVPDEGEETRGSSGGPGRRSGDNARVSTTTFHKNRRNNVGERGKDYAPLSPKARFNANVEAIKLMRVLMDEGIDVPTKDQMEALRQYSGWGGMGTFFNDEDSAENKILRDLLSEEEYNNAALSIKTAYYTPATVIDTLWDLAKAAGFKGGNVLEGSAGIGNILGQMPREMSRRSDIEAVELDAISGNILKLLYPDAKVHIQGFQDTVIPNGTVDLAITNVPFAADISVIDKVDKDLSRQFRQLHDFCIAKNIRKLKEGGIGIFITTSGTLDKSTKLREWIPDGGQTDVIGAFRLHNKTFGGTNVTSDIIVVRKRLAGKTSEHSINISKATPLRVGSYKDKFGNEHQVSMVINDYFKEHPEMMAGEMAFGFENGDTYRPGSYGLYPVEGKNQEKMLGEFVKSIKEEVGAALAAQTMNEREDAGTSLTMEKEGRMLIDERGRLCVSERGVAVPLSLNATKVKGQTKEQCFKDYQEVQKAVDDVLQQQLGDPDDAALKPKLDALNKAFDKFVKRYGNLHKNTAIAFLRNDIDFPSFLALENYSESKDMNGKVTVITRKAPLFSQRVLGFKTEPQPKNVKDAVTASIFRSNSIDVPWIAERLGKSEDDVRKEILDSRLGFEDPSTGQLEIRYKYLSGNVREKLAIAEAYSSGDAIADKERYKTNMEELRKVVPMDIPAHLIDFSLGSSWIPMEIYTDYLKEVYDLDNAKLTHIEGSWVLDEGYGFRNEKNRSAGVYSEQFRETIYGHQLVLAALNNRPVKVQRQVSEGYGSSKTTRTVTDQASTQACAVRVDEIKDEFKQFAKKKMQDNPELSAKVEKIYNEKFNALVPMQIDDEFLPDIFEGANMNIHLYGHQKRGVMRGLTSPTMLAHEVGTGKSFTLISTAMEMKRLGTAKKPMIVVQNATVAQMTADAKLLYPNARVLSLSEKDRSAEGRRSFYAKIKYNDWDLIIVPQSTFERIPDSPERELQFIQEKIDEKKHVIEAAEQSGMDEREIQRLRKELDKIEQEYGDTFLERSDDMIADKKGKKKDAKQEAASLEKAKVKAQEQLDRAVDDVQYFDDLGVDALLVDEAHEYKHLGFQTSIGRGIKGIDPSYSKKCAGLYNKTRSVFEKAGWKNVVFATGTPISNTAAEIWTFMKYLMPADVMRANDIYYFDDFVHNFGAISQMLEFATSGKFKENTRFAAYVNKPELIRIWSQVADTVLTREVGAVNEKIPEQEGGKDQDVFLPQSPSLIRIMAAVRKELERFENMTGKEKKENSSIPLTMYGIAKRAAIDPRLVDAEAPDEPKSKTNAAVKEIVKDLEATKDYKGTVAVFCDNQNRLGRTGGKTAGHTVIEFNIYDDMKAKLIKAGVPEGQIAIIKSGMSITAKQKVFDAVNSGDIRVVLGSTQTLGTGVNMQERLHLLIHMDAPDRPMDYTQRNGRIKRQGNLHKQWGKTIRVLRFGVEDSLDVTAYQRLKTKSGFIDSIMDGKGALQNNQVDRTVEEEEEGLFDNPVAVLSGSQYALKKNQAERELRKYQGKRAQWEADQVYVSNALRRNKSDIEATRGLIAEEEKQLAHIRSLFPDGTVKTITVEGVKIDLAGRTSEHTGLAKVIKEKINEPVNATVKKLRENEIYNDEVMDFTIELDGHKVNFKVSVEREAVYENGKMRTVVHKYTTYDSPSLGIDALMQSAKSVGDHLNDILDEVVSGRDNQDRIDAYKAKIERINRETEQLQQRVGMEFKYSKELEQARKNVEEYTELMKQEMKEKEAKYAAQQEEAGDGGFDLHKAEESEEEDEDVRYSAAEDDLDEETLIVAQAKATGTYMKAPNGKPTNLNERQWVQVRTQAFKDWFGDWENDPENASQVVGENGEPKVMYHATNLTDVNHSTPFWAFYPDSHFGTLGQARSRLKVETWMPALTENLKKWPQIRRAVKTYAVFLNIRNAQRRSDADQDYLDEKDMTMSEYWEQSVRRAKYNGHDGIVYLNEYEDKEHPADSWIAFKPEQVKSAQENIGTFDPTNPDIRHRDVEQFREGETFPIHTTYNYSDNVMNTSRSYSTDLMPDLYASRLQLLDGLRRQYPEYWVSLDGDSVRFESWRHALHGGKTAMRERTAKEEKAHRSYIERKTRNAVNAINDMAKRMGLDVEVLTSTEGLKGKKARSKGWFNPKTGKITLVLPNNANLSDLVNTLLHEGVAHYGLRKMFGSNFDTFLDNVYNNVSPEVRAIIDATVKRNKWSRHEATEEYLARLAERTDFERAVDAGWFQKIKRWFLDMLKKVGMPGFDGELSDNELRYILWRSYENLVHPGRYRNVFDEARDVAMQSRLQVGRYARERDRLQRTGRTDTSRIAAVAEYAADGDVLHSIRKKEPPKKTGIGYKVFFLHNGQLYPPMVANPDGEGTPVGIWLDADAAPVAGVSKTGRKKVKAGGKGTQGGSGLLSYRPGWHLGTIPYALQFNRGEKVDNPLGITNNDGEVIKVGKYFPNDFVWAEVEYADDKDYQEEAESYGYKDNGKFQHSLAGLPRIPEDGSYTYRTNPNPATDPWIITGAMRVNRILSREEVADLVRQAGREPQLIQDGDIVTQEAVDALNEEIKAMRDADDMGLLYRDDDDDIAKDIYEDFVAKESFKFKESWQDSMASLKAIQKAIAAETGRVATGAEDAYRFENRMHGRAKNMTEKYDYGFYRPMLKAFHEFCKHCNMSIEHGMDYLISKSGLERNVYYVFRDAARAKITDDINDERDDLEKQYAKGRMSEDDYKARKQELEEREQNGVDEFMKQVRSLFPYQHAKQEYEAGNISYTEYLRIIEKVIHDQLKRKNPKKDKDGNVVSDNYYDEQVKDYSGLTETFAKDMYDEAQSVKKRAQRAIDPDERKSLWSEYNEKMRQAYITARQVAEDQVFVAEDGDGRTVARELWEKINAATKETLKQSYEMGLIDRNNYYKVRDMFDWYIPLRGWEEDKASDVYTYMGRENVFSPAVKKVWGRQSKAENPLAYIGNIAVSTILSGHRNQMKQHFLNYVMNNPTSLVSISESWYENIGAEGDSPVWVLRTADTAGKAPDEIAQIVNDFNEEMRLKQKEGKAMPVRGRLRLDVHATSGQKSEHVVEVQRAGHTYQLYINGDPKAAQALNGSAARAVSRISDTWLGKKISKINRDMAAFFTSKNPAFVVSNLSRDLNMAGASVAINEGKEYHARFIANVAKVLRPRIGESSKWVPASKQPTGLMPSLMRKWQKGTLDKSDETERLFGEFMDEGGETGFVNMLSIDSFKEKMQKEIAQMNGSSLFGSTKSSRTVKETSVHKGLRMLGETFEFYNRCAEDATRFIVYMTSRQMGKTLEESIADAKDVTLNFNRKGTGGMGNAEVRDLFIFVNPAIQALANMYRMAAHHPLKFGAVTAAFVAGGALMPIINQWLLQLLGDDDDKQAYWNLPPWVRKNNLVMWIPGTKNFVTIPLAQEFRVFYGVGEMLSSAVMDHPVDKWGLEIFSSVADLVPINPTGNGGNLMVDFAPTMVQPLMQVGENVDFTGKPIWRDNQGNKHAPMYSKAYVSTPNWMVKVSEGLNDVTGGNEGRKGWVERNAPIWGDYINNPAVWNHLLQGYFGGMYNTIAKSADVVATTASGELPKIYQTPVINRFLNRPVERENGGVLGEEYYSLINERDEVQYEVRTWKRKVANLDGKTVEHSEAQKKLEELVASERYKRAEIISHYEKILKDLKAGERAIKEGAEHSDKDLHDIHESMDLYKAEMLEELSAIGDGKKPLDAAIEKFNSARSFAEKNKLRLRIERLMMEDANGRTVGHSSDVEKAVAYLRGEEVESRKTSELYLSLASGQDIADDARIRAAKARIKQVTDEYKRMVADGNGNAAAYRTKHAKWFAAENIVKGQERGIATNKKLLGKGYDAQIMRLIKAQRDRMLDAIEGLE